MYGQGGHLQTAESECYGGPGGNYADFLQNENLSLVAVRGKAGNSLDSIQFLFVDTTNGQYVESPMYGGPGGDEYMFQAPPGQWINKVYINYGNYVDAVVFETNQGVKSQHIGGQGGHIKKAYETNGRIFGVKIRTGNLVDAFIFVVKQ